MMRKVFSVAMIATLVCAFGLAQTASAGVTVDLQFQDMTLPTGITINPNIASEQMGPGCEFGGYYHRSVSTGYCMDIIAVSDEPWLGISGAIQYDTDNGLQIASYYEWKGVGISFNKLGVEQRRCSPLDGITDNPNNIGFFECGVTPPNMPPSAAAGTYRLGTIIWDTSGTFLGLDNQEMLNVVNTIAGVVRGGVVVDITGLVVDGSHILKLVPEPGTACLLGLGLVGLILAGRRRRA